MDPVDIIVLPARTAFYAVIFDVSALASKAWLDGIDVVNFLCRSRLFKEAL